MYVDLRWIGCDETNSKTQKLTQTKAGDIGNSRDDTACYNK